MGVITEAMKLVGRKSEQERFSRLLDAAKPALVLVQGAHGCGKTSLMHVLQEQLETRMDWSSAPQPANWPLAVTPDLYEADFSLRVSQELAISTTEEFSVAKKAPKNMSSLVESLVRLAPLALFIDGFQPNRLFARWFHDIFLPDVKRSGAAILVILADEPKSFVKFDSVGLTTEVFALGRLKPKEIRERFQAIDAELGLSISEAELDYYVQVVHEKPEYYKSLVRLLQYGGKNNPPPPGAS
jgi:hypothetical protein